MNRHGFILLITGILMMILGMWLIIDGIKSL